MSQVALTLFILFVLAIVTLIVVLSFYEEKAC